MRWPSWGLTAGDRFIAPGGWQRAPSASVDRTTGRLVLMLRNGLQVPVSKTYRDNVKDAGWLEK